MFYGNRCSREYRNRQGTPVPKRIVYISPYINICWFRAHNARSAHLTRLGQSTWKLCLLMGVVFKQKSGATPGSITSFYKDMTSSLSFWRKKSLSFDKFPWFWVFLGLSFWNSVQKKPWRTCWPGENEKRSKRATQQNRPQSTSVQ